MIGVFYSWPVVDFIAEYLTRNNPCRPKGNQTVEGPSQIRYVHYVEAVLYSGIDPHQLTMMCITSLDFVVGNMQRTKPWEVSTKSTT